MSNNRRGIVKNNMRFVHIKFFGTLEVLHSHVEENEKLGRLDKRISEKIGVDAKFIRVTYNGRPIDPMDTPYSLGLSHTANFHVDILKNYVISYLNHWIDNLNYQNIEYFECNLSHFGKLNSQNIYRQFETRPWRLRRRPRDFECSSNRRLDPIVVNGWISNEKVMEKWHQCLSNPNVFPLLSGISEISEICTEAFYIELQKIKTLKHIVNKIRETISGKLRNSAARHKN